MKGRRIRKLARKVGLDFETEIDEYGNSKLLLCCLNGKNYEDVFDLRVKEDYERFFWTIVLSGDKYIVYNASFDVEIIITILLKNNFTFLMDGQIPSHKTMRMIKGQKIYSLTTYFMYKGKLIETSYVDLGNIITNSNLSEIAKKFTNLTKGDYNASKGEWDKFVEYCMLDAEITRVAYEQITKVLGMETLTIGSAAFRIFLKEGFTGTTHSSRFRKFKKLLGETTVDEDAYFRLWYAGGLGWSSDDERVETRIHSYDLKSAYPSESVKTIPTLIGKKVCLGYESPTSEYPFAFIHMKVTGQVKENHVPVLPSRNIYGDSNIYIYDDKDVYIIQEYGVKSEYDYWLENMDIEDIEYVQTTLLKKAFVNPLEKYMLKYYNLKESSEGVERETYKMLLNSLTGKLGTNPIKENTTFRLDLDYRLVRDESEQVTIDTYATHVISVITSRVRCKCYEVDTIIRDKTPFRMYATDSVKHTSNGKFIQESETLGGWSIEKEDTSFIFLGLKAYIFDALNEKGERQVICAGISREYKKFITNEQFYAKTEVPSLISVRKGNGRIIFEGMKKIVNPIKKPRRRLK